MSARDDPPSSLAHHLEFQVVAFADIRTYYLEGEDMQMICEGGRRVIARGHDADVVGPVRLFLHIVPPDGKLLSSLARHRDRHVVILLLHHVSLLECRARADEGPSGGTNPPRPRPS